jgi:hypothetical protein
MLACGDKSTGKAIVGRLVVAVRGRVPGVSDPDVKREVLSKRQEVARRVLDLVKGKRKAGTAGCPGVSESYFEELDELLSNQVN